MKNLYFFCLLVFCASCVDNMGTGKRYPIEQTHGHPHDHDHDHAHEEEALSHLGVNNPLKKLTVSQEGVYASENRDLWQRPDLIIHHLGNLDGKTIADIGAGPVGYFSFIVAANTNVKKVLALDIDEKAISFMDEMKVKTKNMLGDKIETRLVKPEDLRKKMPVGGRLVIVDYKMKEIPDFFPAREQRIPLFNMEEFIDKSGFKRIITDDTSLQYQYIIIALNPQ